LLKEHNWVHHKIERVDCVGRAINKCGVDADPNAESCRRGYIKRCHAKHQIRYTKKNFRFLAQQVIRKCACDTRVTKKCTSSEDQTTCITTERQTCVDRCNIRRKLLKDKLRVHIAKPSGCSTLAITQCGADEQCQQTYITSCKAKITEKRTYLSDLLQTCSGEAVHP